VTLDVHRDGATESIRATLGALEPTRARATAGDGGSDGSQFGATGMAVSPLTPDVARELGLSDRKAGVVVREVNPDGTAAAAGLRPGDIISQVNGAPVKTPGELQSALGASSDRPALLLVTRENADIFLALRSPRS
jgi:serine protease Do